MNRKDEFVRKLMNETMDVKAMSRIARRVYIVLNTSSFGLVAGKQLRPAMTR